MTAGEICRVLGGRKIPSGFIAKCPAHDDKNPSLSITEKDGQILAHCHAGCSQERVIEALKSRGLWPENSNTKRTICSAYDYTDAAGKLLYQVVRFEPKAFAQRQPDGAGGWIWRKSPVQVLYRLREVIESSIVFVVEGEKDVETIRSHGLTATCEAGGANAPWLPQFTEALRGREVVLIPDNDPPGRARVGRIARALLGSVARLVILELDGAKDASEWFAKGHSELELIEELDGKEVSR
jgi:5S rRNA maturation endonuclease (ribonuclease M5)